MTTQTIESQMVDYLEGVIKTGNFSKCFGAIQGALVIGLIKEYRMSESEADRICDSIFNIYLNEQYPNAKM